MARLGRPMDATCTTMDSTALGSASLREFTGIGDPSACYALCTIETVCHAWTLSGYLPTTVTHYGSKCLADEFE